MKKVFQIDPQILSELAKKLNDENGFGIQDESEVYALWAKTKLPFSHLGDSLSALKFAFEKIDGEKMTVDSTLEQLREFCALKSIDGFDARKKALRALLTPKEKFLRRRKVVPFLQAVEHNLEGISGVVQLRAAFADKDSDKIVGYVPVVMIQLRAELAGSKEKCEIFTFQVSEKALDKLIANLETYKQQLKSLRADTGTKLPLLDISTKKAK